MTCILPTTSFTTHYLRDEGARADAERGSHGAQESEQHQHAAARAVARRVSEAAERRGDPSRAGPARLGIEGR